MKDSELTIGVLALQGSFAEHVQVLGKLGVGSREVRAASDLEDLDGIVLPGGESSAMGVVEAGSGSAGLFATLSTRITEGFPAYGTCAGLILLADRALCQKSGGQPLLGGLSATVCRNYFGAQVKSCELPLACCEGGTTPAVFIRAPAILQLHADDAEPLATVDANPCDAAAPAVREFFDRNPNPKKRKSDSSSSLASAASSECGDLITVIVAAKQRNIIVTAFHPELTNDTRWHARFLDICRQHKKKTHKFTS